MSDWLFYALVWWGAWYAMFLIWYEAKMKKGEKMKMGKMEAFFAFLLAGLTPVIAVIVFIIEAFRKTK